MEKRILSGGNMEYLFLYTLIVPDRNLLMFRSFRDLVYVAEAKNIFPRIYSKRWITFLHDGSRVSFGNSNVLLIKTLLSLRLITK